MTIREAERVIVQRARRYCETLEEARGHALTLELLQELMASVRDLEEAEKGARFAAKRHTRRGRLVKTTPAVFPVEVYVEIGSGKTLKVTRVLGFTDLIRLLALLDANTECREWGDDAEG